MARIRNPYPSQASLTADQVSLSDYIYATDVVSGAVNNSTLAAPKPIAAWLTPDFEHVTGSTLTARLAVAHAHARDGKPVAAVKFVASDGTHTVEQLVSTMSARQWSATGLYASYFESSINISTLTQGICTLDAVIYPWVGTPFQISLHADAWPSSNLCPLKFVADHSGGYGRAHAYVSLTGNDGTGVVSTSAATAAASPYATVLAAVTAIKSFNNSNFGRNEAGGGVVHFGAGTHTLAKILTAAGTVTSSLTLLGEGAGSTTLQDPGTLGQNTIPIYCRAEAVTLKATAANTYWFDNGATTPNNLFVIKDCVVNVAAGDASFFYRLGRVFMENSSNADAKILTISAASKGFNIVGTSIPGGAGTIYHSVASRVKTLEAKAVFGNNPAAVGLLWMNNHSLSTTTSGTCFAGAVASGSRGLAVIGNVFEKTVTDAPAVQIYVDDNGITAENILFIGNTTVGSRCNWMYNDKSLGAAPALRTGYRRFNLDFNYNCKSDIFAMDGAYTLNWSQVHSVAMHHNAHKTGFLAGGANWVAGSWLGEVQGIGSVSGQYGVVALNLDFANDASTQGTALGNGDYTPGPASVAPLIPAGSAHAPIDLYGRTIPNGGTGVAGAIQRAA